MSFACLSCFKFSAGNSFYHLVPWFPFLSFSSSFLCGLFGFFFVYSTKVTSYFLLCLFGGMGVGVGVLDILRVAKIIYCEEEETGREEGRN